jgi:hypothetical protein
MTLSSAAASLAHRWPPLSPSQCSAHQLWGLGTSGLNAPLQASILVGVLWAWHFLGSAQLGLGSNPISHGAVGPVAVGWGPCEAGSRLASLADWTGMGE